MHFKDLAQVKKAKDNDPMFVNSQLEINNGHLELFNQPYLDWLLYQEEISEDLLKEALELLDVFPDDCDMIESFKFHLALMDLPIGNTEKLLKEALELLNLM